MTTDAPMRTRTLPPESQLRQALATMPEWMHPTPNPFGVVLEGCLTPEQCAAMVDAVADDDAYTVQRCGAQTRQYDPDDGALGPLIQAAVTVNQHWWQYEVEHAAAWLQTYTTGGKYAAHMDAAPGMSRKVSAVAMVSDPAGYEGGDLTIRAIPKVAEYRIPRKLGTVVVFQPWLIHDVSTVTSGLRRTVNLGLWGPALR